MGDPLAELVRRLRLRAGLTQEELAEKSGISVRTIRGIETGRRNNPRLVSVRQIGAVLTGRQHELDDLVAAALGAEPEPAPPAVPEPVAQHHQLPMDIAEFTGRDAELADLLAAGRLAGDHEAGTAVAICAVVGMAGVGKTRLAVRAAHQLVADGLFPDVQLWADLHGFHLEQPPTDPAVVLERFLRALGVRAHEIPDSLDERASVYRTRLHGRRVLVLLDDASTEEQVRPLLPGSPGSLVLVTSRRSLTGLDGAVTVNLDVFSTGEAVTLMTRDVGTERVAAEPEAAEEIVRLCGQLPLAVAMTSRHLRNRPSGRLADLAARLTDDDRRLSRLSRHDRAVRQTFDLSYRSLSEEDGRLFRLLALHPGDDFAAPSVAALAGIAVDDAELALDLLLDEHLLLQAGPDRYRMHDLIRLYGTELAQRVESEEDRLAAFVRVVEHYVRYSEEATLAVHPTEVRRLVPGARTPRGTFAGPADAVAWVEREFANLVETAGRAARSTDHCARLGLQLVRALYRPLANRGHSTDRISLNHLALRIARRLGDGAAEALAQEDLGTLCAQVGLAEIAIDHTQRALTLWTSLADATGQQGCHADLGNVYRQRGDFTRAAEHLDRSLAIAREHGNRPGEASVLNYLGQTHQAAGEFAAAAAVLRESIAVYRELGNRLGEAISLANLGWATQRGGDATAALDHHRRALLIFRDLGDRYNEAEQLWGLGQAHHALAQDEHARHHWLAAIEILRDIGLLDSAAAAELARQRVPDTPEIIRLNT
jgi:tetratricopeptide (TPR) repeat protein/transcriptional regulator with XRE-family HTH domain